MGANAQTSVPAFVTGQVLTAQQQTEINTGIPVFATTVTRDAAFGGTGEKTLAQGQYAYIEATSTLQVYTGSAWVNAGSLVLTGSGTAAGTATTLSIDNCFSTNYANYMIWVDMTSAASANHTIRMRVGGSDNTTASYLSEYTYWIYGGATGRIGAFSNTSFTLLGSTTRSYGAINIINPFATAITTWRGLFNGLDVGTTPLATTNSGYFNATTSFDGLSYISSSGNLTGTIRVYGLANS
jgi:hypothetical protein